MGSPPKIDDFSFEIPDIDTVAENKAYLAAVKKVIMGLRNSVKIKGTLAADLMELYGIVNNAVEINAKFDHYVHNRNRSKGSPCMCRFKSKSACLLFNVILVIQFYHEYIESTSVSCDKVCLDGSLKYINSILKDGLKAYGVKGDEREGYVLVRR